MAAPGSKGNHHDVFIHGRGPDVKQTLASYLYDRLYEAHGSRAFLDTKELRSGETYASQIKRAIETVSVHVAFFSPGYAQSRGCLTELVLMLESKAPIIPVFYYVSPADLRQTKGNEVYAEDLGRHEKKGYDPSTIQKWREALARVAAMRGFELEACNGDEEELLEKVIKHVMKVLKKPGYVAKHPIGLDEKVRDFEKSVLLQQRSGRVQVVGITGMAGVGKTTLAKEFFDRKNSDYNKSYFLFLFDESENAERSLSSLQSELFRGLTQLDSHIGNIDQGIDMLRMHLSASLVLLVLDDLGHVDQLVALFFPLIDVLHRDSLILITSRDKDVLTMSGAQESSIYKLTGLDAEHSRELFCLHAFGQRHPLIGFEYWVDEFLRACDGLPLSLIVVGSLLSGINKKSYWECQLGRIKRILPNEIQQRLKISYDTLSGEEQQIFLDIACSFIGETMDTATRTWEALGWQGLSGFQNLQNKCIVELDSENRIHLHNHFRALEEMIRRDVAEISELPQVGQRNEN